MPIAQGEGTNNVHFLDGERSWRYNTIECLGLKIGQGIELLALGAFLHIICTVALNGQPVVPNSKHLGGHRSPV